MMQWYSAQFPALPGLRVCLLLIMNTVFCSPVSVVSSFPRTLMVVLHAWCSSVMFVSPCFSPFPWPGSFCFLSPRVDSPSSSASHTSRSVGFCCVVRLGSFFWF